MTDIYKMDLLGFARKILYLYLGIVGVYAVISYIIYAYRYNKARKSLKVFQNNLKRLASMYRS